MPGSPVRSLEVFFQCFCSLPFCNLCTFPRFSDTADTASAFLTASYWTLVREITYMLGMGSQAIIELSRYSQPASRLLVAIG